jgi:hypothetical protein
MRLGGFVIRLTVVLNLRQSKLFAQLHVTIFHLLQTVKHWDFSGLCTRERTQITCSLDDLIEESGAGQV